MPQFINNLTAPEPPYECELAVFPIPVIPFALAALDERVKRFYWASNDDWRRGEQLIRALERAMLEGCLDKLIESNNRIYRLLDYTLMGHTYTVTSTEPLVIEPAIPDVPDTTALEPGLVARIALLQKSTDNAYNGTVYAEYSNPKSIRAQLDEIIAAIQAQGQLDDDMLAELIQIAAVLA